MSYISSLPNTPSHTPGHELEVAQIGDTAAESSYTVGRMDTTQAEEDILNLRSTHDDNWNHHPPHPHTTGTTAGAATGGDASTTNNVAALSVTTRTRRVSESSLGSQK